MIHFLIHATTIEEASRLSYIQYALEGCFPDSRLHVINQTGTDIPDSVVQENTKSCGFGWTLRFLAYAQGVMQLNDLLIKIDPDIEVRGNPLDGILIPQGACFGQIKHVQELPVFLGGFQGFTADAIDTILRVGRAYENEPGKQDPILYKVGAALGMQFISLPWIDIWADPANYDPNYKVLAWRRDVS